MADVLADLGWWVHEVTVERWQGEAAYGQTFAAPVTVTGFYNDRTQYSGGQIVEAGKFAFPASVPFIPVQSRVTLPAQFGGRVCHVVSVTVADGGGQPTPDHQEVGVL